MATEQPSLSHNSLNTERKLTLVLLSYERQDYIRRQLLYYSSCPVHIVIADGSAIPWEDGLFGQSGDMTWEYLHVSGYYTYRERFALALERVTTEYTCLVEDQECILWTGLRSAVLTLDAKNDHVCAGGLVSIAHRKRNETVLNPWGHRGVPWELTDPDPLERFRKVTGPEQYSANLFYQVTRTNNLRSFAQMLRDLDGNSLATHEVALAGYLALAGKWSMGNYPYWIRAGDTIPLPLDAVVIISAQEIQEICSNLLGLISGDQLNGAESLCFDDLPELCQAIEYGWGESSEWATTSQAYVKNLRAARENGDLTKFVRRIRIFLASTLQERAPRIYCALRPNSIIALFPALGFLDYARAHSSGSYEVANDLLTVSEIWHAFPQGVSGGDQISKRNGSLD